MLATPDIFNGKEYTPGLGRNSLAEELYLNAGSFAQAVGSNSLSLWDREDSAYQRMVEDMKKAGLNPWTGVSSGGLNAGTNNPSMDSLSALIGILGGILDSDDSFTSAHHAIYTSASKLFNSAVGAVSRFL